MGRFFQRFYNDDEPARATASTRQVVRDVGILASSWAEGSPFLLYHGSTSPGARRLPSLHIGNNTFSELFEFSSIGISEVYCCAACGAHFAQYKVRSLHTVCVRRLLQLRRVLQDLLSTNFRGRHAKPVKCAVHGTSPTLV